MTSSRLASRAPTFSKPSWRSWLGLALVACLVLLAIVLDDTGHLKGPVHLVTSLPLGDKIGHFMAFGALAFFVVRVAPAPLDGRATGSDKRLSVPRSLLVLFALVALEELSQAWIPWRHCDPFDLLADALGMALFSWISLKSRRLGAREPLPVRS
jgi:VanZ family protein